jgi:hypothetical protein
MKRKKIIGLALAIVLIPLFAYAANKFNETWFGGGYGSTGATIYDTGNIATNGTLTVDSTSTQTGTVSIGGGYGSTGVTLSDAGVVQMNGALTVDGASTQTGTVSIGGGYGSTGATISDAGVIQANGAVTSDGTLTVGGGYGSTGVTLSDAGVVQMNGALTSDSTISGGGTLTMTGTGATNAVSSMVANGTAGTPIFAGYKSRDSLADTEDTDVLFQLLGYGKKTNYVAAAVIRMIQDGASGATYIPGKISFQTATNAATYSEAMHIDNARNIHLGAATTNYANFDATGHLTFAGTGKPWEDLRIEPTVRVVSPTTYNPTWTKWSDNGAGSSGVYLYVFDDSATEKEIHFTTQFPHSWDGGAIYPHVHWLGQVNDTTAAPNWGLEYMWKDIGETFATTSIVYTDGVNYTAAGTDANVTAQVHYMSNWAAITPGATQNGASAIMVGRVFRRSADASDTYNATDANCALLYIDIHYQLASVGSTDR